MKFLVNIRDTHKTEQKNCISICVSGYENKEKYPIYAWNLKILSKDMLIYHW